MLFLWKEYNCWIVFVPSLNIKTKTLGQVICWLLSQYNLIRQGQTTKLTTECEWIPETGPQYSTEQMSVSMGM